MTILSMKASSRVTTLLVGIPNERMRAGVKISSCLEDRELARVLGGLRENIVRVRTYELGRRDDEPRASPHIRGLP